MIKSTVIILILLIAFTTEAQNTLHKWQKAILNIECHEQFSESIWEKIVDKSITYREALIYFKRNKYSGTAIFLKYDNSYYLITAKHVVFDDSLYTTLEKIEHKEENYYKSIFSKIILIPSADNWNNYLKSPPLLMNLGSGGLGGQPYLFSENLDLAVINLDYPGKGPLFVKRLLELGYEPISISDINFKDSLEVGNEILCLGFPAPMSRILNFNPISLEEREFISDYASLPVASFGKIAQYHKAKTQFLGDVSIYPGNSGGPVIFKNKLVGIISAQPVIPVDSKNSDYSASIVVRIPFGYFEKAGPLKEMLHLMHDKRNTFFKIIKKS